MGALDGRQNVAGLEDHRLAGLLLEEAHRRLRKSERLLEQVQSVILPQGKQHKLVLRNAEDQEGACGAALLLDMLLRSSCAGISARTRPTLRHTQHGRCEQARLNML